MATMRGMAAGILEMVATALLKARDRLRGASAQERARERFRAAVSAIRCAGDAYSEEEVAEDVEIAIREVREARRAASSR